jgi:glyoxylase-like metal-dependent hydrolase (beta-lactamase superfamily II)
MAVDIAQVRANNPSPMTLTGTNTYVITSGEVSCVVDPGPLEAEHLDAIVATAEQIVLVLSTHRHSDHTAAVDELVARTGASARAISPGWCRGAEPLHNGEAIALGDTSLRILATPGHTSDSMSVLVPEAHAVLTGDTVLGGSTTVLEYPDGTLRDYLASLDQLEKLGASRILPGHGDEIEAGDEAVRELREHRLGRLKQIQDALAQLGEAPRVDEGLIDRLVELIYPGVAAAGAARLSVAAQLDYLAGASS